MEHFAFIKSLLGLLLYPKIDSLIKRLYGNIKWDISRVTVMDIFSGSEEQEIHVDGKDDKEGIKELYLFIPLMDHDKNIGGTIYYDNEIVGKYKKNNKMNFGYFKDLNGIMRKDFEKARYFNPPVIGDICVHTNETIHGGAENKSQIKRRTLFLIITLYDNDYNETKNGRISQPMTILKCEKTNDLTLTVLRNEAFTKRMISKHNLKIINPKKYINQYDILPQIFTNEINFKGFYIVNNNELKNQVVKFINLIKDIEKLQKTNKLYKIWVQDGFSGNPYILHDKREMIELYQIHDLLEVTEQGIQEFGKKYGKNNGDKITEIHFNNMFKTHNIMLFFMPLIFNITQKLNYNNFTIANVKYYKILPGGKDQQLHCDGTFDTSEGDNIYLIYSLKDTTIDMGGTNFYLNHKLNDKYKNINPNNEDSKCIGFIESLKDKEMFYNAEYKSLLKKGELSVHLHNTIHKGCGNSSNVDREFIFFLIRAYK